MLQPVAYFGDMPFGSSFNVVHRLSSAFFSGFKERGRKHYSTSAPATSQSWLQPPWPLEGWTSLTWPMSSTMTCLMMWTSMCTGSVCTTAAFFCHFIHLYSVHDIYYPFIVSLASDHQEFPLRPHWQSGESGEGDKLRRHRRRW